MPRAGNANGARAKLRSPATVPVTAGLVRCYSDYMYVEYGDFDSDYVFVNLWAGHIGAPMTYAVVHELVGRIRARTGVDFTLHMLRHTHATDLKMSNVARAASFGMARDQEPIRVFDFRADGSGLSRSTKHPSSRPPSTT